MNPEWQPSVQDLIWQRFRADSMPGNRNDPFKIGLCIEGGAMRGVISAGQIIVLELLGIKGVFDVIYGASAGAFNGAFFAANQALYGTQIYLDHANSSKFISLRRPFRGKRLLNLEYMLDDVMIHRHPIDWEAAVSSSPPLRIIATDAIRAKTTVIPIGDSQTSLFSALRASAHIPGAHGSKPYHLGGKLLWDAAILDPFCLDIAVAEGCTHLLVLMSLPLEREREASVVDKYFVAPHLEKFNPALAKAYIEKYSQDLDTLEKLLLASINPRILTVAPPLKSKIPGPLTKRRSRLGQGAVVGAYTVLNALAISEGRQHAIISHIRNSLGIKA